MKYSLKYETLLTVLDPDNNHYNRAFDQGTIFETNYRERGDYILTNGTLDVFVAGDMMEDLFEVVRKRKVIFEAKWGYSEDRENGYT